MPESPMPQFLIERNFAEQLEVNKDVASTIKEVNDELSLRWVFSFLSADKKKTYCLYEAPNAEAIREAARRLNIPADTIIELGGELRPEMFE
jgi:hypothetical protein